VKKCPDHTCPHRSLERRTLLKAGAAGTLLAALPVACNNTVSPPTGPVSAGNVSQTTVGQLTAVSGEAVFLGRDADGLYAVSAACTHAGCMLNATHASAGAEQLSCPCHGSVFDANGAVLRGPAGTPLPHFQVDVATDGTITIQGGQEVSAETRTPVA
jgi:cytochrome b6-f complex iron-sulfur subunit